MWHVRSFCDAYQLNLLFHIQFIAYKNNSVLKWEATVYPPVRIKKRIDLFVLKLD